MPRRPVQKRAAKRRASLLDAAAALLEREGYSAVTTNAIAREAKAAIGTVYDYFPDKEAVLAALLERYRERLQEAVMPAVLQGADDIDSIVERGVHAFATFYRDEPGYAELWLGSQLVAPLREAGDAWGSDFATLLGALVQQKTSLSTKRSHYVATALVHAISSVVTLALTKPPAEQRALIQEAIALAQGYLQFAASRER